MKEDQFSLDETTLSVDLSDATQAVKESRFEDALNLLKVLLKENPNHIDILYLSAVSTRFLKQFEVSLKHIERLLFNAPDMGRAYQELGHLNRDMGNEEKAVMHYRQACELNPALPSSWSYLHKYFEKIQNKPAADHALEQIKKLQSLPGLLLVIEQILNEG